MKMIERQHLRHAAQFLLAPALVLLVFSQPFSRTMIHDFLKKTASNRVPAGELSSPFVYTFNDDGVLEESGSMEESSSPYFWLNSGGRLVIKDGIGATMEGDDAGPLSRWRVAYSLSSPEDTDGGIHPQNLFRLVTRSNWQDMTEEVRFMIKNLNLSKSSNRNESNGVLLFARYGDSDNLYYAGVRVDGQAVIKKKTKGVYYTLKLVPWHASSSDAYDRDLHSNFLPVNKWIGMKLVAKNIPEGGVDLKLFLDQENTHQWVLATEAVDDGENFGGAAFTNAAHAGIRTDFMDVEFDNFALRKI